MEKYRPYVLLGIAVIVALITSFLAFRYLRDRVPAVPVESLNTQPIAIAAADLSWGTKLTKDVIQTKPFLKESLPAGYITKPESLEGRVLIYPVKANQPILESDLAPITVQSGGIAAVIKTQKRAIAVKVDKVIGVSGFINPNNRVDVLVTIERESNEKTSAEKANAKITKTVLENILVLAAGQELEEKKEKGETKSVPVDVITLEVTPEEGEKLALAASEGKIQLALRNFSDTEEVMTKGSTVPTLLASFSQVKEVKTDKQVQKKTSAWTPAWTVEVIKGNSMSEVKFNEVKSK